MTIKDAEQTPEASSASSAHDQETHEKKPQPLNIDLAVYLTRLQQVRDDIEHELSRIVSDKVLADTVSSPQPSSGPTKRPAHEMGTGFDEEDDDDDDDQYIAHDPKSESMPRLPIYHPAYKVVETAVPAMLQVLHDFISETGHSGMEVQHLSEEISTLLKVPYGQAMRLGLVGDTGAGKSAGLNAMLGIPNVSVESDGGESVTNVVIEFAAAPPTQKTPVAAEVEFFEPEMCMNMVKTKLEHYYTRVQKDRDNEDLTDDENQEANTTLDTFVTLFRNHKEFADRDASEEFLAAMTSGSDQRILNRLYSWTHVILNKFAPRGQRMLLGAVTIEDLTEQYLPFTTNVRDASYKDAPLDYSPWPLVRLVRVLMRHRILDEGVIIADLPGMTDYNKVRISATQRYLKDCERTICFGRIDRVETSPTFIEYYTEAFRRRRHGSVVLVVTRTDDLKTGVGVKSNIQTSPQDEEILSIVAKQKAELEKVKDGNRREIKRMKGNKAAVDKITLTNNRISHRITRLTNEATELRVLARNAKVTHSLAWSYRTNTKDETRLPIFCVSNWQYMMYVNGPDSTNMPTMQLANTQVPTLRSHIFAMPSKGKFATLEHYSMHNTLTLLNIIEMSCSTSTLERKDHLVGIVRKAGEEMFVQIEILFGKFLSTDIEQTLMVELQPSRAAFIKGAEAKCNKFQNLSAAAHKAFIKKQGFHKTPKVPAMNWNAEFLEAVKSILDRAFGRLIDELCMSLKVDLGQSIKEVMNKLDQELRDDPAALVSNVYKTVFLDNLERYRQSINEIVDATGKDLQKHFRTIHNKSATEGQENYFVREMTEIYAGCDYSPGQVPKGQRLTLHRYRCIQFRKSVCADDGPYCRVLEIIHDKCKQTLSQEHRKMQNDVRNILRRIRDNFESMDNKKANDPPKAEKFREDFTALLPMCREIINEPVKQCLDLCRQYK